MKKMQIIQENLEFWQKSYSELYQLWNDKIYENGQKIDTLKSHNMELLEEVDSLKGKVAKFSEQVEYWHNCYLKLYEMWHKDYWDMKEKNDKLECDLDEARGIARKLFKQVNTEYVSVKKINDIFRQGGVLENLSYKPIEKCNCGSTAGPCPIHQTITVSSTNNEGG